MRPTFKMFARRVCLGSVLAFVEVADAPAATLTLSAAHDATIFENNPDNASGAGNGLFAGTNGAGSPRRALVAFDLTAIPPGATISSVELSLVLGQVAGSGGGTPGGGVPTAAVGLHRTLASWTEGETGRRTPPTDGLAMIGQGAPAETGDVTWSARSFDPDAPVLWTASGGDFVAAASATLVVGVEVNDVYAWQSTTQLIANVQSWVDAPATNYGWTLVNANEANPTTFRAFYSRDVATLTYHPRLLVEFEPPSALTADFNGDMGVDGADLIIWQRGLGLISGAQRTDGDATGDQAVDALDLARWRNEFGQSESLVATAAVAVPEPRALGMALMAAFLIRRMHDWPDGQVPLALGRRGRPARQDAP